MYVVIGANGRVGGETAAALIAMGKPVRVVLREQEQAEKWKTLGAETAVTTIEDRAGLAAAFADASGAFLLCPPPSNADPFGRADEVGRALARAVRDADVPRIVVLSSIGAQHQSGTGIIATLNTLERHLHGSAPATTFLRPGYFIETWSEVVDAVMGQGVLPSFLEPGQKIPMVSTRDVGRAAAELLVDGVDGERVVELRGAQDWSANDVAAAFGHILGRAVQPVFIAPPDRLALLTQQGVPVAIAEALLGMYEGIASGRVEHDSSAEQRLGEVALVDAIGRLVAAAR